jgi:hypothetical protein
VDDLIAFLRARLDEREQAAKRIAEVYPEPWELADRGWMARVVADEPSFHVVVELDQRQAPEHADWLGGVLEHIVLNAPSTVLAEVDAQRQILDRHKVSTEVWDQGDGPFDVALCERCAYGQSCNHCFDRDDLPLVAWPCPELRLLALPYARHPDYREAWRP